MSWVPAEQVLQTVANQRQILAAEQQRIANFHDYHATERAKLEAERAQAAHDLGQALLPKLDAASIAAAAQTTGLVGLTSENIPAKLEARRVWLGQRINEIARNPNYAQRELLRHPRTGSLMTAIAEAEEFRQPARAVVEACEMHIRFGRLWSIGWGTPQEKSPWWRYSYWEDRSAAQEIVKLFPGKTTFAEVRDDYVKAKETLAVYDADIARLRGQVAAGEALEREYAVTYGELQNLDATGLEHTRGRIIQHLLTSDPSLVSQRLRSASALNLLFLRASGIAAKISYLDGVRNSNLDELQRELNGQRQKLDMAEQRTRKRWAPMPLDKFQKLAEDRRPRYEKRWQRFGKVYQSVYTFDRYERARYYDNLLWWDLMTRGRYDGSYIPEVVYFRQNHPNYRFDPGLRTYESDPIDYSSSSDDDAQAAATAIEADSQPDDGGDTPMTDAS